MKIRFLTTLLLCGLTTFNYAGNDESDHPLENRNYPVPQRTDKLLFYVQRSHNSNTIIYELNYQPDGKLDKKEPLHPSWVRYEEGGMRKELSFIQNRVYGLNVRLLDKDTYMIIFRSYKKKNIYLMRTGKDNLFKAMIKIDGKMAELTSIFICSITNKMGIPSTIKYIDLNGIDPSTGAAVNERIILQDSK